MRRTKSEAEQTKNDLVMAALEIFSEQGYAATKLSDIAKRAGTTRGAIYWHFENKDALFSYLINEGMNHLNIYVEETYSTAGTFLERTKKLYVGFKNMGKYEHALFHFIKDNFLQVRKIPAVESILKSFFNKAIDALKIVEREIVKAQIIGEIKKDIDVEAYSASILNFLALLGMKSKTEASMIEVCLPGFEMKDYSNELVEIVFNGLHSLETK